MTSLMHPPPRIDTPTPSVHTAGVRASRHPLLDACRPHQWVKNGLVFAVPFIAGQLLTASIALAALAAAVVFVLASSATYLINDIGDVEADRRHPTKRLRPIASGALTVPRARQAAVLLLVAAIATAAALEPGMLAITALYLATTTCYSRWLKRIPIVDVVAVASGFLLRALAGGIATGISISPLFLAAATGGALFIVIGKRLGEVIELGPAAKAHRRVLDWYSPERCRRLLACSLGTTVAAFSAWALTAAEPGDRSAIQLGAITLASLAILPFLAAAERVWHLVRAGGGADPLKLLTHDRVLPLCGLACGGLLGGALYL